MTVGKATPLPAEPLRKGSRLCAASAIAIGLAVLAGWVFGAPFLMQVLPGQVAMVPNTAVGLLLAGVALWLRAGRGGLSLVSGSQAAAAAAGFLGFLNLVEYVSGRSLGIDELLFRDPAGLTSVFPGRMAVLTAVSFVALAAALLTLDLRWPPWTSDGLALLPGVLAMVSLSGYTYGLRSPSWIGIYKGMAIHTALAFLVLTIGVLLVHARGVSRLLVSDTAGGIVARRILPVALLAPFILGWLRIAGQERGLYGLELGRALYAAAESLILIAILLGTAGALMRVDEKRRGSEEALRTAEEQYRLLFENSPQPMWVVDRETLRYLAANDAAVEHYGYSRDEFLSMNIGQLRPAEDFAAVQRAIPNVNAGLEKHGLWRHLKKDGTLIHVDIATHTLTFKGRSAWLVLAYDVTDRLRAVETLRKLSRAVEQSPVSVVITDTDGAIEYVNPKFTRVTGYSSEEVLGRNPRILKSGELSPELYREMWNTITAGGEWRGELHNRKKDGELFWEFASISPILDEKGKITHFIAIKEDITGRKLLETQLRASQKMEGIGRLAGGIAHDFNNLLTAILGYSELMEAQLPDDENLRSSLREIRHASERAAALTRQLLAFSRRQVLQPELLDLNAVVSEVETLLRRLIGEDVRLATRLDPALGSVKADPGQLEQVLMNLVVNARDAMPEGGTLTIETANAVLDARFTRGNPDARSGEYAVLTVADTGIGMSDEVRSHAFEPFFTTKEHGKGTGLGLATAYGIVKQSDGHITVESEPGRGTTFRIYFPHAAGAAAPSGLGERPVLSPRGAETILLVEDEPGVRRLARTILEAQGYAVLEAASGDEALAVARSHPGEIHLVATDVIMPGISGRVLWDRLQGLSPNSRVLFMSGYTDDAIARHGVLEPGIAFLQKPFTPFSLAQKVREVLDAQAKADA